MFTSGRVLFLRRIDQANTNKFDDEDVKSYDLFYYNSYHGSVQFCFIIVFLAKWPTSRNSQLNWTIG